MLMHMCPL